MILNKLNLWPFVLIGTLIFTILTYYYRKKYFYFTNRYFFKGATKKSFIAYLFTVLSFATLMFSLMDLRGAPERIDSSIPDQKTIIIIDASASMLAEDVRPNRFQKSLLMARHFIKNAVGHQISLVLFSDSQRKLVPFTDDIDLLDAKVSGLEGMNITTGGSNIGLAINESLQYFKEDEGSLDISQGNILVFTDSEENDDGVSINIPDTVNVAFVGVGTLSGGPIPLRGKDGGFRGYKTFNGENVITKLNESYLKDLQANVKNFKYWIVQSYNIPTDEILEFFKMKFQSTLSKGTSIVQPVEIRYTLLPFYVFLALAAFFRQGKGLKHLIVILVLIPVLSGVVQAQEANTESKEVSELKSKLEKNSEDESLYMQLAAQYLREKNAEKASLIYKERIDDPSDFAVNDLINSGTAELLKGDFSSAVDTFKYIEKNKKLTEEQRNVVRNNIVNAQAEIDKKKKEEKEKKEQEEKKDQEKKEQEEQDKKEEKGQSEEEKEENKENKKEDSKGKDQKGNQKKPGETKDEEEKKDKKKEEKEKENKDSNKEDDKEEKEQPKSLEDKENEIKKKRKMVKIPAALKQILDDDKNLQKRTLERIRNSKDGDRSRKDW